ncbi:MAG: hypothetical protein HZC40_00770 [Chloroflexi bacterium]|nr:hypothetical protein [Chloroflexota bacterium]
MPFKRRSSAFAWEEQAARGEEFVATVSVRTLCRYPTRMLRSANASGIFVVRRHKTMLAVLGSPRIWFNVLTQRSNRIAGMVHPQAYTAIENVAMSVPTNPQTSQSFTTITWSVRRFLENVQRSTFFDPLNINGVVIAVLRYARPYALMIPASVLAWFWNETAPTNSNRAEWVDELIEFARQLDAGSDVHTASV